MRLRNRITKATYYTDPDLCRMPRDKRDFYRSLWACAEDSACLEDDMFGVKLAAWPSPLDADLTVEKFDAWRDELIAERKLIPYEVGGKKFLYIPAMAEHEKPRNPQPPDVELPPWVTWIQHDTDARKGRYEHSTEFVRPLYNATNSVPAPPRPALSSTEYSGSTAREESAGTSPLSLCSDALVQAFGAFPNPKQTERLRILVENYGDDAPKRIAYGIAKAQGESKTNNAYAIGCAENASRQELARFTPSVRGCPTCSGTGTHDGGTCPECLGTRRVLSRAEWEELTRAQT